ncbi:hypothetical protein SKAU_G00155550 [Synaphobranchus kaupii]|uniref:Uncharacterized protein n=1 Tax=Synaphobranchus kaupii TaxID=118154 RepID=A0A9Q1FI20_SYNKA|nr:hypothetical protein SKAU_G00155550 [Synaphobranchus kaupii]
MATDIEMTEFTSSAPQYDPEGKKEPLHRHQCHPGREAGCYVATTVVGPNAFWDKDPVRSIGRARHLVSVSGGGVPERTNVPKRTKSPRYRYGILN